MVVGTDGARLVVWGLGSTELEAWDDASQWIDRDGGRCGPFVVHSISDAQADVVRSGDVSWPVVVK